jgi:WD40 repeat protein
MSNALTSSTRTQQLVDLGMSSLHLATLDTDCRSDSTLRIFSTENGETKHVLSGHSSRIWDCAVSSSSSLVASASGDGTVQVWTAADGSCRAVLDGDAGDVYGICWRPDREVS